MKSGSFGNGQAQLESERAQDALARDLRRLLGAEAVLDRTEFAPYRSDSTLQRGLQGEPQAVIRPGNPAAVAAALSYCYKQELGAIARGGGTGLAGGATPIGGGVVFSMQRLIAVRSIQPEQWRMEVQAGLSTAHVARLARENGLYFAPDPGAAEQSQIGGNVATNAGGPHAFKYGRTAQAVSGMQVVMAPGELVQLGAAGRRDYSGYDLAGLMIGAEGTLGIVTSVALKLRPAPECAHALVASFQDRIQGCMALDCLLASGLQPAALDFVDGSALTITGASFPGAAIQSECRARGQLGFVLLIEADGSEQETVELIAQLQLAMNRAGALDCSELPAKDLWQWRDGIGIQVAGLLGGRVSEDICVPVEAIAAALDELEELAQRLQLQHCAWGHAGDGIIHVSFLADPNDRTAFLVAQDAGRAALELALRFGGSITGEHGVGWVKREFLGRDWTPVQLQAQRSIKQALDPKGLLNPGKKLPLRISQIEHATS